MITFDGFPTVILTNSAGLQMKADITVEIRNVYAVNVSGEYFLKPIFVNMLYIPYVKPEPMPKNSAAGESELPESITPETSTQPVNAIISAAVLSGVIFSLNRNAEIIIDAAE